MKTKPKDKGPLLTVKEVAELDNCSEKTVRRAIEQAQLTAIRIGPGERLIRIHPADHEAYRRYRSR